MATLAVTPTVEPNNSPPRVRLDITASGTPTVTSVTVTRTDAGGRAYPVRTSTGGPLPVSGGVATAYDYEIPYGMSATYAVAADGVPTVTTAALVDVPNSWLVHVGVPAVSTPVEFRINTNQEEELTADQGIFPILGSSYSIPVTGSARQTPASELIVGTDTPAQAQAMRDLLADGSPLLLNVPPLSASGLSTCYISVASARVRRRSDIGSDPGRDFVLPYRVVGRPAGGSLALRTWATVGSQYATWSAIPAGTTWAQLGNPVV